MGRRSIVYYAYLGDGAADDAWVAPRLAYMARQLDWLAALVGRMAERPGVLVPYLAPERWDRAVADAVAARGFAVDLECVADARVNRFEYPGFRALRRLARAGAPDDLLFYAHSKGIVQLGESKMGLFRLHSHVALTADLTPLAADPALTRAGLFPSRNGWCWYNLFWVTAGWMATRDVAPSDDRYAFEALIGTAGDREGWRGVLPLIDRLAPEERGVPVQPWYRAIETISPELSATHARYAAMAQPPA